MQVKSKIFPYPVLNNDENYTNYVNTSFNMEYTLGEDDSAYILKDLIFSTNSETINKLVEDNRIDINLVIECSDTVFRKAYKISKIPKTIRLLKSDFSEKVDISMFATASQDFTFMSNEVDDDYQNILFEIEKYDILCANDGFSVRFMHNEMEKTLVKSIFSIIPNMDLNDGTFGVDCELGKKITISLSSESYYNYKTVSTVSNYKEVFFDMLLIPALIEGLVLCQKTAESVGDLDDVGNKYKWFRSILNSYKRINGKELTIEDFLKVSPVLFAQDLLGKPLGGAMEKLVKEIDNQISNGDDANE